MIRLIDRKEELKLLESDWKQQKHGFIVVYGRRRIGKTALLSKFLEKKEGVKYTADDTNKKIQIREFKDSLAHFFKDEFLATQDIGEWSALFSYLSKTLPKDKKMYLWIDEFSYLIKTDASITSVLQKFIDGWVRDSNIVFIVSGSLFGLMSEKILSHASPLYGRRTRDLLLQQLPLPYHKEFLNMNFEDTLKTTLTIGGIPEYLLRAAQNTAYNEFIQQEFFKKEGYFFRELIFLLSQEFKEIKTYFSLLNAVAYGHTKPNEIAQFAGINAKELYPYLELLITYGFIKRQVSLVGNTKRGIYVLNEPFIDFWFNFVHKHREQIENNTYALGKDELHQFLGKRFEMLIRENLMLFIKGFEKSGRWWYNDAEIDIIALNETKKEMLIGECKWQENVESEKLLQHLEETAKNVRWHNDERKESYALFAKSFKNKVTSWNKKQVLCFDLKDIEKALQKAT